MAYRTWFFSKQSVGASLEGQRITLGLIKYVSDSRDYKNSEGEAAAQRRLAQLKRTVPEGIRPHELYIHDLKEGAPVFRVTLAKDRLTYFDGGESKACQQIGNLRKVSGRWTLIPASL